MEIQAVVVLKHPVDSVWRVMRDELERLVELQDGIRELSILRREQQAGGPVRVVSVWQAAVTVPALAAPYVSPEMFRWTDDTEWDDRRHECRWRITTHHLTDRIACSGATHYEPALGGRGARITMRGDFSWDLRGFLDLPAGLEAGVARGIESFVGGLIPRNFRKVTDAARRHLENSGGIIK